MVAAKVKPIVKSLITLTHLRDEIVQEDVSDWYGTAHAIRSQRATMFVKQQSWQQLYESVVGELGFVYQSVVQEVNNEG